MSELPGDLRRIVEAVAPEDAAAVAAGVARQARLTKPPGALGVLEDVSVQLCGLAGVCPPPMPTPAAVAVFAADHGVYAQGVTPWPQEVTAQMVANFVHGGAAVCVLADQAGAELVVVDVGVASDLPLDDAAPRGLLRRRVREGTRDLTVEAAMTRQEAEQAMRVHLIAVQRRIIERLTPGRYSLMASLRGQSSSPVEAVVQGSQSRDDLLLELSGGAAIHGLVKGLPDSERAGVQVNARGPEQYFASARTGADGSFELVGAPLGPISLNARVGDFTTGTRSATGQGVVAEGQADVTAEIVFEPGFKLEGTFTRAGAPVPEAHISAFPLGGGGRSASSTTNASGQFALEGLAAGRYQVHASTFGQAGAGASASREVELTGDTTVDLVAALGRLSGSVVESETRRPLNGAVVELSGDGPPRVERATTDSAGRFELEDLEPGPVTLTARKSGYETATRPLTVQESGSEATVELRRGEGVGLVARDGIYGTPLRELFVRVLDPAGTNLFTGGVSLDSEGRGEVPGLPPGSYELRVDAGGYAPAMLRGVAVPTPALAVSLTAGGTLEVASGPETLGRPGSRARLLGGDGLPYFLNIFSLEGWLSLGQPLRQFENVAPGTYTLAVENGPTRQVEIREGGATRLELP